MGYDPNRGHDKGGKRRPYESCPAIHTIFADKVAEIAALPQHQWKEMWVRFNLTFYGRYNPVLTVYACSGPDHHSPHQIFKGRPPKNWRLR